MCGGRCKGWYREDLFRLRGLPLLVRVCECYNQSQWAPIAFAADLIHQRFGLDLISGQFFEWFPWRQLGEEDIQWRVDQFKALKPAHRHYQNGRKYYVMQDLQAINAHRNAHCAMCDVGYNAGEFRDDRGVWINVDGSNYTRDRGPWFCSKKCREAWWRARIRELKRTEEDRAWLRKGKQTLRDIRKLLRSPGDHAVSPSRKGASGRGTTSLA